MTDPRPVEFRLTLKEATVVSFIIDYLLNTTEHEQPRIIVDRSKLRRAMDALEAARKGADDA